MDRERGSADAAMDRYAGGDDSAFADVYDSIAPRVFALLVRTTRDDALAEDLLQQTLLTIHRARGSFIAGSPVLPWAYAIARRLLLTEVRKARRSPLAFAESELDDLCAGADSSADRQAEAHELVVALQTALARLPDTQQAAFTLMRLEGLSHEEAAVASGATVSAIKLRAHRAYQSLRRALAGFVETD